MTVHDLIEVLKSMPADAEVWLSVLDFDGGATLKGISTHSAGQMVVLADRLPAPRPLPPPPPPPPPTEQECRPGPVEPNAAYVRGTWNGAGWTWPTLVTQLTTDAALIESLIAAIKENRNGLRTRLLYALGLA